MQYNNGDMSSQEWPTLNDVVNRQHVADERSLHNEQTTTENISTKRRGRNRRNIADGQRSTKHSVHNGQNTADEISVQNGSNTTENDAAGSAATTENGIETSNTNNNAKAAKKKSSKKSNWKPIAVPFPPYIPQRGNGRRYNNDSSRPFENGQSNHASNGYFNGQHSNGRGIPRSRGTRGNHFGLSNSRGRGFINNRPRREVAAAADVETENPVESEVKGHLVNGFAFYPESQIHKEKVKRQIEYYFSEANLANDKFIRERMDKQGYVSLELIADFNRLKKLRADMPLIVEAVRESSKLELYNDLLVRPVVDPLRWPLPKRGLNTDMPEFYPGQPYLGVNCLTEQMDNMHINGNMCSVTPSVNFPYIPNSMANGFSVLGAASILGQESNGLPYVSDSQYLGVSTSSLESNEVDFNDPSLIVVPETNEVNYIDQPLHGGLGCSLESNQLEFVNQLVPCSSNSSSVDGISCSEYYPQPVFNHVTVFATDPQSTEGGQGHYSTLNPTENCDDQTLHNTSPEPTRKSG